MDDEETRDVACARCGHVGLDESDGFFYCQECGAQADDIIATGVADEDFIATGGGPALYNARRSRRAGPAPTPATPAAVTPGVWDRFTQEEGDGVVGPREPGDFGAAAGRRVLGMEDYCNETRMRYVMGLQWMVQMQTRALVERLKVSPLVMGVAGTVWLRYLSSFPVFADTWADTVIIDYEIQTSAGQEDDTKPNVHFNGDNPKDYERAALLWFRSLRRTIPLSSTLAISFLACHVAREPVLPTDIVRWSLEGKLPYFAAHVEIDRRFEGPSPACPISSSRMFRPYQSDSAQKVEYMAAIVAETIGLRLPPVNFPAIASRFLNKLSLPAEKILSHALKIYEWSLPPELWLSTNRFRLPTRIYVLSILIVAIRILYDLNGFGTWEKGLSKNKSSPPSCHASRLNSLSPNMRSDRDNCSKSVDSMDDGSEEKHMRSPVAVQDSDLDSEGILNHLEAIYHTLGQAPEHEKDLRSYLQYCKDVVFAGSGQSHLGINDEEELIEKFWDFYLNEEDSIMEDNQKSPSGSMFNKTRLKTDDADNLLGSKKIRLGYPEGFGTSASMPQESSVNEGSDNLHEHLSSMQHGGSTNEARKDKAIRMLKLDMEENRFCYIPPRVNLKRFDYLHYVRKKDDGAYTYAAHADYYILLRVCAKLAEVDARIMHMGVLGFERRLAWLEKRIDHCLHATPPDITCEFCADKPDVDDHST